jgi:hypothetical protein
MPLTWRKSTLHMEWCLDCHRHPEDVLRPKDQVLAMGWQPGADTPSGTQLAHSEHIRNLTHCSACHR